MSGLTVGMKRKIDFNTDAIDQNLTKCPPKQQTLDVKARETIYNNAMQNDTNNPWNMLTSLFNMPEADLFFHKFLNEEHDNGKLQLSLIINATLWQQIVSNNEMSIYQAKKEIAVEAFTHYGIGLSDDFEERKHEYILYFCCGPTFSALMLLWLNNGYFYEIVKGSTQNANCKILVAKIFGEEAKQEAKETVKKSTDGFTIILHTQISNSVLNQSQIAMRIDNLSDLDTAKNQLSSQFLYSQAHHYRTFLFEKQQATQSAYARGEDYNSANISSYIHNLRNSKPKKSRAGKRKKGFDPYDALDLDQTVIDRVKISFPIIAAKTQEFTDNDLKKITGLKNYIHNQPINFLNNFATKIGKIVTYECDDVARSKAHSCEVKMGDHYFIGRGVGKKVAKTVAARTLLLALLANDFCI